jgi:hypothetical protein
MFINPEFGARFISRSCPPSSGARFAFAGFRPFPHVPVQLGVGRLRGPQANPRRNRFDRQRRLSPQPRPDLQFVRIMLAPTLHGGVTGLEMRMEVWEFYTMNAIKVDSARRIRLTVLTPGDYYEPEIRGPGAEDITLRRVTPPRRPLTQAEALKAIEKSPLRFTKSWDQVKEETRG